MLTIKKRMTNQKLFIYEGIVLAICFAGTITFAVNAALAPEQLAVDTPPETESVAKKKDETSEAKAGTQPSELSSTGVQSVGFVTTPAPATNEESDSTQPIPDEDSEPTSDTTPSPTPSETETETPEPTPPEEPEPTPDETPDPTQTPTNPIDD